MGGISGSVRIRQGRACCGVLKNFRRFDYYGLCGQCFFSSPRNSKVLRKAIFGQFSGFFTGTFFFHTHFLKLLYITFFTPTFFLTGTFFVFFHGYYHTVFRTGCIFHGHKFDFFRHLTFSLFTVHFGPPFWRRYYPLPPFFTGKSGEKKNQYFCNIFGHLSSVILKKIINYLYFLDITVV